MQALKGEIFKADMLFPIGKTVEVHTSKSGSGAIGLIVSVKGQVASTDSLSTYSAMDFKIVLRQVHPEVDTIDFESQIYSEIGIHTHSLPFQLNKVLEFADYQKLIETAFEFTLLSISDKIRAAHELLAEVNASTPRDFDALVKANEYSIYLERMNRIYYSLENVLEKYLTGQKVDTNKPPKKFRVKMDTPAREFLLRLEQGRG